MQPEAHVIRPTTPAARAGQGASAPAKAQTAAERLPPAPSVAESSFDKCGRESECSPAGLELDRSQEADNSDTGPGQGSNKMYPFSPPLYPAWHLQPVLVFVQG